MNGMRLYDVEVLDVLIGSPEVANLLGGAMNRAIAGAIQLSEAEQSADREAKLEELRRQSIEEQERTKKVQSDAALDEVARTLENLVESAKVNETIRAQTQADADMANTIRQEQDEVEMARAKTEVDLLVKRVQAIDPNLTVALNQFGDKQFVEGMLKAVGGVALSTGVTSADILHQVLKGTPFEGAMETLTERPYALQANNNGE